MTNNSFKIPLIFDVKNLLTDLKICLKEEWPNHFNTSNYNGNWKAIALRSPNGESNTIFANSNSNYINTKLLDKCRYFSKILNDLECPKEAVRLLKLDPGSEIKMHTDHQLGYENGSFRLHIPIQTNKGVCFLVNNQRLNMESGTCWYANFNLPHSVVNHGRQARIHLIIDCHRNEWTDVLFKKSGYDFDKESEVMQKHNTVKKEDIPQIINQLALLNTTTANALIETLKEKINLKD